MKSKTRNAAAWLFAASLFVLSGSALATNGYFTHGVGTQSKGMAGTGIGSNADMGSIMTASNPALGVFVNDSWEAGLSVFSPRRSYEASDFESSSQGAPIEIAPGVFLPTHSIADGKVDSSSEYFPIPWVSKNWSLANDGNITFAFYGRGGMNTDWDDQNASATSYFCGGDPTQGEPPATGPGPYCAGVAGVDLSQAFINVNYSAMIGDNFSWGIGPVIGFQMFEAKGVGTFVPVTKTFATTFDPAQVTSLTDNGHDTSYGYGLAAGIWWGITDTFSFGLSYQSKLSMSEFDDYSDLYAQAGGFDIPSSIKGGVSWLVNDSWRINFDVEQTAFSEVDSVGNPMVNLLACDSPVLPLGATSVEPCLGGEQGAGFGWDDMTTYKIGIEWASDQYNLWRFGYSYGEQPVQEADVLFNILAPGVMEQHFTIGWTRNRSNGHQFSLAFMYAPENDITGPSLFDPAQTITLSMSQFELEFSYRFGSGR
jgi:long-chain fatty acid transport protein